MQVINIYGVIQLTEIHEKTINIITLLIQKYSFITRLKLSLLERNLLEVFLIPTLKEEWRDTQRETSM